MHGNPAMRGGNANTAYNYLKDFKQNQLKNDGAYEPRNLGNGFFNYDDKAVSDEVVAQQLVQQKSKQKPVKPAKANQGSQLLLFSAQKMTLETKR